MFRGLCSQTIISFGEFYCPSTVTQWPLAVLASVLSFDSRSWASFLFAPLYSELHDSDLGQALIASPLMSFTAKCRWQSVMGDEPQVPGSYKTLGSPTSANEGGP